MVYYLKCCTGIMTGKELIFQFEVCCICTARLMVILKSKYKGKGSYIDR